MLPSETFAEVVAFLRLFDLNALVITNAKCSSLAIEVSRRIRWEEFAGLHFRIANGRVHVLRGFCEAGFVANLNFPNEKEAIEFVTAAFPNCVFEDVFLYNCLSKPLLDAINHIAGSVVIKGALRLDASMSPDQARNLVRKFRKVKALRLMRCVRDDEILEIANFYRLSGVSELQYYRPGLLHMQKMTLI